MDGNEMEEVVKLARKAAYKELLFQLELHPKYISRREAEYKYKFLLWLWENMKWIKPINLPNGKNDMFSLRDLVERYQIWIEDREVYHKIVYHRKKNK